jgi:catecholate siderophore receptor
MAEFAPLARPQHPPRSPLSCTLLAGMGLSVCQSVFAQSTASVPSAAAELRAVVVQAQAEQQAGKDALRAVTTTTGKGQQALRDIPQSITVVTEKLIDERNLDNLKDVLHNTAGITFQAAEGGEEDIRLRGFSLATTGDIYLDGIRDPAFYDRDTFNVDRVDVMRGSASMLFGRGSTGGVVNQVSKQPQLTNTNEHEVNATVGSHGYRRVTGDFNLRTGEHAALRINAMRNVADNNGAGSGVDKTGLALTYRWGIDTDDEFSASVYTLDSKNPRMNYGLPWMRHAGETQASNTINTQLSSTHYYGMSSDRNASRAQMLTLSHTHHFDSKTQLKTQFRKGLFSRDQRASTIRTTATLDDFGPNSVITRGTQLKIQNVQTQQLQSDLDHKFLAFGHRHALLAGVDLSRDAKQVYAARSAALGGVNLTKPSTTFGSPNDSAWVDEDSRVLRQSSRFRSSNFGVYAQDMVNLNPEWKAVAGLRWDRMRGQYDNITLPTATSGPETLTPYAQKISALSKRAGLLYQPNELHSYHVSWGTSFNTSGDTYSYNAQTVNTPPEQSRNIEIGAKIDSADKRFTTRVALFRATKFNERNTDPLLNVAVLSGKRHAAGFEIDFSGFITPQWEIYGSYMLMPSAVVDVAVPTTNLGGSRQGDRPGLTPRHTGTVWNTYQFNGQWRAGAGINFRSRQAPPDVGTPANGIWQAPGWATLDLMGEYTFSPSVALKVNLSNVANKVYADSLYRGHYVPGAGRLLQATLTTRF